MPRKLNTYVHIDGTAYGPNDDLPADVAKRITNPDVWADQGDDVDDAAGDRPAGNASREAWAEFATAQGVQVTDEMNRGDIIAAVDAQG